MLFVIKTDFIILIISDLDVLIYVNWYARGGVLLEIAI